MPIYIGFLRGINVGGHKKIKMAQLREALTNRGLTNLITYIQSGNLVFKSDIKQINKLENLISKTIHDDFGFDVPVIIRTKDELQGILDNNPFENSLKYDPQLFCVSMLSQTPTCENIELLNSKDFSPELYIIQGNNIYLYPANGLAKSKMSHALFETKLKVRATTRNWRTLNKMLELSKSF